MKTRTVIFGKIVLGAPLYVDGECIGIVASVYCSDDGYIFCEINSGANARYVVYNKKDGKIYLSHYKFVACANDPKCCNEWIGYEGLIGAGDINDGDNIYIRLFGDDKKHRINSKAVLYNKFNADMKIEKQERLVYEMYAKDDEYLLPVHFNSSSTVVVLYLEDITDEDISPL